MAVTNAEAVTFAQSEPLESGVTYPEPTPPPKRDLYNEAVQDLPTSTVAKPATTHPDILAASTVDASASIPEERATLFRIIVTDPIKETVDGVVPGMKSTYHTYCVTTTTTMQAYSRAESSVRRRFRDFVNLSNLLEENYRGFFVPPRPHRSWYQGKFLMRPAFIEQRRVLLERYLRALASHPTISTSNELRVFLEAGGKIATNPEWRTLHNATPSLAQGTTKFFRQMIGKERITPSVAEVSKPSAMKKDIVWKFRNSMKNLEQYRHPQLYDGQEFELRKERDTMEEFKKDVEAAWKWASCWMDRTESTGRVIGTIAEVMTALSEYEIQHGMLRIEAPGVIGKGASRASEIYRQCLQEGSDPLSTIYNYTEMMRPVLAAMKSREQALNTVQMLERDLEAKRAKQRQLEIQPTKQARLDQLQQDITAVEASLTAAQGYYDRVTKTNTEEAARFRNYRSEDWMVMLKTLARVESQCSTQLRELWIGIARELGADAAALSSIQ